MFLTMHKEYAVKIQKQQIKTLTDFFKLLPDIKPFNETINGKEYPNAFLIDDFQVAMEKFGAFIYVLETLKNKELISLYFNSKLRNSINIIQKSQLNQGYEKSAPFYPAIWNYETKEIRIRDEKFLKKFIKTMLDQDTETKKTKHGIFSICMLSFAAISAFVGVYMCLKPQKVIITQQPEQADSSISKTSEVFSDNKIDSLDNTKLHKDTLKMTKQKTLPRK